MSIHAEPVLVKLPPGYRLLRGHPSVPEYLALRRLAGLSNKTSAQAKISITGSWYACYIAYSDPEGSGSKFVSVKDGEEIEKKSEGRKENEMAVAMARIIGDGGWYFHIIDMAVLPTHQQRGLGNVLMQSLLDEIKSRAPPGAYVNLIGSVTGAKLYKKFGFVDTIPTGGAGMQLNMEYVEGEGPEDEVHHGTEV